MLPRIKPVPKIPMKSIYTLFPLADIALFGIKIDANFEKLFPGA